jgi:hypothetical protein
MDGIELVRKALAIIARLPRREVSAKTARAYRRTFQRMRRETPAFDPLKGNIARDTFNHRRAALHFGSRRLSKFLAERTVAAAERQDAIWVRRWAHLLNRALSLVAPAIERDPPLQNGASSFDMPRSRWQEMDTPRQRRGRASKKHSLKKLPPDWMDTLWTAVPSDWPYQRELAVHMLIPSRPAELVPGVRPHGSSPGAIVELLHAQSLQVTIAPVKSHRGRYGSPTATVHWDPVAEGGPAAFLAELCDAAGGHIVVSMRATNPMRKSLGKLGREAFPGIKVVITPNVIRAQLIADLKATTGAGEQVAAAAGHSTDRTQARYGRVEHGRKRKGFRGAVSARQPTTGNVARAHQLGKARDQSPEPVS